ncbi:MAG: hypothetical protein A2506_13590 [Elusimicrobia bacterium RIFOXYD12_FULL_66_9]|nr:MAG: hypothetical protein A2506_13590 [Elusimicrobia bacterium RIFOXYD12_FULL_66_9]
MRSALAAVILALSSPASAVVSQVGTASAEFLRIGAGARALGMGEAFSAVAEGPEAAYWNPAGLAHSKRLEFSYARAELPAGLHHDFGAISAPVPLLHGTFAFAFTRLSGDKLAMTDASNRQRGTFAPHSEVFSFAYGRELADDDSFGDARDYFRENWNVPRADRPFIDEREPWTGRIAGGLAIKVLQENLGTRKASGVAFDGGGTFRPVDLHELILAGAFRHVGPGLKFISESAPLPSEAAFSAAYDLRADGWRLLPAIEVDAPYAGQFYGKFGVEGSHQVARGAWASLRLGYNSRTTLDLGPLSGLTAGTGVRVGGFSFDAAFQPMGLLGSAMRIAVGWRF